MYIANENDFCQKPPFVSVHTNLKWVHKAKLIITMGGFVAAVETRDISRSFSYTVLRKGLRHLQRNPVEQRCLQKQ